MKSSTARVTGAIARWSIAVTIASTAPMTTMAQASDPVPVADATAPRPVANLKPGTARYKWRLDAGAHSLIMDVVRTIKDQKGAWLVTETNTIPGFTITDEGTIDKKTLILRKRRMNQGDIVADLQYPGSRVTGTIIIKGQTRPIDIDMGGPSLGDGPGGQDVIATLPLAKAYSTTLRSFDITSQRVQMVQLRVMGTDTVTVPAGTFNTWKVLMTSADGSYAETGALWIDKKSRRVVKMATTVPELNGAVGTGELVK
jgi:hypothetical protein